MKSIYDRIVKLIDEYSLNNTTIDPDELATRICELVREELEKILMDELS